MEKYTDFQKIAEGNSSIIYKALDSINHEIVIIKEFLYQDASDDLPYIEQLKRYKREIEIHLSLEHKNIIKAKNYFEKNNKFYLVMEYKTIKTLYDFIEDENTYLSLFDTIDIIKKIAKGLQYIHDKGIIHRDIKPNNILIDDNKDIYIIDFGCAKRLFSDNITNSRVLIGTINYMSPEQINNSDEMDTRTDIFALGCVFYQLIANKLPFKGENIRETINNILNNPPSPLNKLNIPFRLENIIHKTLIKDQNKRYSNANLLINQLDMILEEPELYYFQAKYYEENNNINEARNLYMKSIEKDNYYLHSREALANLDLNDNNLDEALEHFKLLIKLNSSNSNFYAKLAEIYYQKNNFVKAFKNYQKAWLLNPIADYEIYMTNCQFYSGKIDESLELFLSIIERYKEDIKPRYYLAILYYKLKQYNKSLELFEECLKLEPLNYDTLFAMASLYQEIENIDKAISIYSKLEKIDKNNNLVIQNLANIYYKLDKLDKAEEKINILIKNNFKSYKVLLLSAFIYKSKNDKDKELEAYNEIINNYPNIISTYIYVSDLFRSQWNINAAINILNLAMNIETIESKSIIYFKFARLYQDKGDFDKAEKYYNEFLLISPKNDLYNIAKQEIKNITKNKKSSILDFRRFIG